MSTREREPEQSGPLKYAPERALASAPELSPSSDWPAGNRGRGGARPQSAGRAGATNSGTSPATEVAKQKGSLEGDVAIEGFASAWHWRPTAAGPPMRDDGGWMFGIIGRLAGCVAMAASPLMASCGFRHRTSQSTMVSPTPATPRRPMSSRIRNRARPRPRPCCKTGRCQLQAGGFAVFTHARGRRRGRHAAASQ